MSRFQKGFIGPIVIAVVAVLAIGGVAYFATHEKAEAPIVIDENSPSQNSTTTTPIVGGDRDAYGCIGSAGYTWCAVKNKCLRVWEEKCEVVPIVSTSTKLEQPVACTMDAMMCPDGSYVGRSGPKCEFVCPE